MMKPLRPYMTRRFATLFVWCCVGMHGWAPLNTRAEDDVTHARALSKAFRDAAKKIMPSVVTLTVYGPTPRNNNANNPNQNQNQRPNNNALPGSNNEDPSNDPSANQRFDRPTELGSGVIISSDGWILTNHHVIDDAKKIEVETNLGLKFEVVETFSDRDSDIAVVRVQSDTPLPAAEIGLSDNLDIGDWVLAIGSPFQLQSSVSAGIISAKGRSLPRVRRALLLQTDAAINPGNSGGPLIDLEGKVIGINTAIATLGGGYEGIGFAVPSEHASWISSELRSFGKVRRALLGAGVAPPSPQAGFKPGTEGALVVNVATGSAAAKAGLKTGDLIIELAGQSIRQHGDVRQTVERLSTDMPHKLVIMRDQERMELEVQLQPANP